MVADLLVVGAAVDALDRERQARAVECRQVRRHEQVIEARLVLLARNVVGRHVVRRVRVDQLARRTQNRAQHLVELALQRVDVEVAGDDDRGRRAVVGLEQRRIVRAQLHQLAALHLRAARVEVRRQEVDRAPERRAGGRVAQLHDRVQDALGANVLGAVVERVRLHAAHDVLAEHEQAVVLPERRRRAASAAAVAERLGVPQQLDRRLDDRHRADLDLEHLLHQHDVGRLRQRRQLVDERRQTLGLVVRVEDKVVHEQVLAQHPQRRDRVGEPHIDRHRTSR